jgi:hypothetical protein
MFNVALYSFGWVREVFFFFFFFFIKFFIKKKKNKNKKTKGYENPDGTQKLYNNQTHKQNHNYPYSARPPQ